MEKYINGTFNFCEYSTHVVLNREHCRVGSYKLYFKLSTYGFLQKRDDGSYLDIIKGLIFDDVKVTNSESYDFGTDEVTREMAYNELKKIEEDRDLYATIANVFADADGVSVNVNDKFRPSQSIVRNFDFSDEMVAPKKPWWKRRR